MLTLNKIHTYHMLDLEFPPFGRTSTLQRQLQLRQHHTGLLAQGVRYRASLASSKRKFIAMQQTEVLLNLDHAALLACW